MISADIGKYGSPTNKHGHHAHHHHHVHVEHDGSVLHKHNPDHFFVVPRGVILEYGPYVVEGVCDFRVERLQGIQKMLGKVGARVKMIPCTDHLNRVQLWYMDSIIFSCKVTDLEHGGDGELDQLCITAAKAFDHASRKALHGLRHRFTVPNEELQEPFCPCLNPHFYDDYLKESYNQYGDCEGPDCPKKPTGPKSGLKGQGKKKGRSRKNKNRH